jgi:hypothetical protein
LLIQLNFIEEGLVLCINMQHNVCEMMGQAAVMVWLSKACSGQDFTDGELNVGNLERYGVSLLKKKANSSTHAQT